MYEAKVLVRNESSGQLLKGADFLCFTVLSLSQTESAYLKTSFKADIQESPGTKKKVMKQHQSPVCTTDAEPEERKSDTVPQ